MGDSLIQLEVQAPSAIEWKCPEVIKSTAFTVSSAFICGKAGFLWAESFILNLQGSKQVLCKETTTKCILNSNISRRFEQERKDYLKRSIAQQWHISTNELLLSHIVYWGLSPLFIPEHHRHISANIRQRGLETTNNNNTSTTPPEAICFHFSLTQEE